MPEVSVCYVCLFARHLLMTGLLFAFNNVIAAPLDVTRYFSSVRMMAPQTPDSRRMKAEAAAFISHPQRFGFSRPPQRTGLLAGEVLWYRALIPSTISPGGWIIEIPYALSGVKLWYQDTAGRVIQVPSAAETGLDGPEPSTMVPVFFMPDELTHDVPVLIRVESRGSPILFKTLLWEESEWQVHQRWVLLWYGSIFGVVIALLSYNLFLSVAIKETSYVYSVLYLSFMGLLVLEISGLLALMTNWPKASQAYLALASAFGLAFCNRFLEIRETAPTAWWFSLILSITILVLGIQYNLPWKFVSKDYLLPGVLSLGGLGALYCLVVSIRAFMGGYRPARALIVAFIAINLGFFLYVIKLLGMEFPPVPTHRIVEISVIVAALMIALALADRISLLSSAKIAAEEQTMKSQQLFSRLFIHIQELERENFSNTLHDAIGHGLLVAKSNLQALAEKRSMPEQEHRAVASLVDQCRDIIEDVRELSHELHPHTLRRLGLKAAIESTMDRALTPKGIDWMVNVSLPGDGTRNELQIAIYRILQEALNNVLKHANANEVIVSLTEGKGEVILEVKDDGDGMPAGDKGEGGIGITTMKGRAQLLGGWMKIHSSAAFGTSLQFGLPLR